MIVSTLTCADADDVEDQRRDAGAVGDVGQREHHVVLAVGHGRHDWLLHRSSFLNPGALLVRERGAGMNTNTVIARELDRAQHQDLRAGGRHLEHLLVRDRRQLARVRHDARVGGEHARDVGVDLAGGAERGRERDRRRVRAAAAERRDLHRVAREALEAGDEDDLVLVEGVPDPVAADLADLGLHVRRIGEDAGLRARQRDRLLAEVVNRHRDERARDPLAGREQHVELADVRRRRHLVGEVDQAVGRLAHRRDGADDPKAPLLRVDEPPRDVLDLVRIGDRRAAELHHDGVEVHGRSLPWEPLSEVRPTRGPGRAASGAGRTIGR